MGLSYVDLEMLLSAYQSGAQFTRAVSIGRLNLNLYRKEVIKLQKGCGNKSSFQTYRWKDYAEPYCRDLLGITHFESIDCSAYEGASIIHDMNYPIPVTLAGQFDLAIDGGSLEHIFNFPTAIANMMRLVKVGGRLLTISPANNMCGHGFYQFTPELLYRIFFKENGFAVESMVFSEHHCLPAERRPPRRVVRIKDPQEVGQRVIVFNRRPLMLRMLAVKNEDVCAFARPPQQSDYVSLWRDDPEGHPDARPRPYKGKSALGELYKSLPVKVRAMVADVRWRRRYRLSNPMFYGPHG